MIEISITLKSAKTGKSTLLGKATIHNTGDSKASDKRHNYVFTLLRKPTFATHTRRVTVDNWPRDNKTVWQLLQMCLNNAYEK